MNNIKKIKYLLVTSKKYEGEGDDIDFVMMEESAEFFVTKAGNNPTEFCQLEQGRKIIAVLPATGYAVYDKDWKFIEYTFGDSEPVTPYKDYSPTKEEIKKANKLKGK